MLLLAVSTPMRLVLYLHHRGLNCPNRNLCCSWTCLHLRGLTRTWTLVVIILENYTFEHLKCYFSSVTR